MSLIPQKAVGVLSFTADIWSDRCHQSFLCIMVHWIGYDKPNDQGLALKSSILAFHPLHGKHSGVRIAEVVYHLLGRAGLMGAVCVHILIIMIPLINNDIRMLIGLLIMHPTIKASSQPLEASTNIMFLLLPSILSMLAFPVFCT